MMRLRSGAQQRSMASSRRNWADELPEAALVQIGEHASTLQVPGSCYLAKVCSRWRSVALHVDNLQLLLHSDASSASSSSMACWVRKHAGNLKFIITRGSGAPEVWQALAAAAKSSSSGLPKLLCLGYISSTASTPMRYNFLSRTPNLRSRQLEVSFAAYRSWEGPAAAHGLQSLRSLTALTHLQLIGPFMQQQAACELHTPTDLPSLMAPGAADDEQQQPDAYWQQLSDTMRAAPTAQAVADQLPPNLCRLWWSSGSRDPLPELSACTALTELLLEGFDGCLEVSDPSQLPPALQRLHLHRMTVAGNPTCAQHLVTISGCALPGPILRELAALEGLGGDWRVFDRLALGRIDLPGSLRRIVMRTWDPNCSDLLILFGILAVELPCMSTLPATLQHLVGLQQLREVCLQVEGEESSTAALSGLTQITQLQLLMEPGSLFGVYGAAAAAQLTQLRVLALPLAAVAVPGWRWLSDMRQLQLLSLHQLHEGELLDAEDVAAAVVHLMAAPALQLLCLSPVGAGAAVRAVARGMAAAGASCQVLLGYGLEDLAGMAEGALPQQLMQALPAGVFDGPQF